MRRFNTDVPDGWSELDSIQEDFARMTVRRSYPTRADKKWLIEDRFSTIASAMRDRFSYAMPEEMGYSGAILARREAAVLAFMEKAAARIPEMVDDLMSAEELVAGLESGPSRTTYDGLDMKEHLVLAMSLWILDDLKRTGKIHEAYGFLPSDYDEIMYMDLPLNFFHPCFEDDLIRSVMCVIRNRNRRAAKTIEYRTTFANEADAKGRRSKSEESEYRKCFEGLIELVDKEQAKAAGEAFKEKVWDAFRRYAEAMAILDRRDMRAAENAKQKPSVLMVNPDQEASVEKMMEAVRIMDGNDEIRRAVDLRFEELLGMDAKEIKGVIGDFQVAKKISGFSIDDPYELCFGFLYLLDKGDDAPWMFRLGFCVLSRAAEMLPWHKSPFDMQYSFDDQDDWEWEDKALVFDQSGWIEKNGVVDIADAGDLYHKRFKDGKNLAQIVFGMSGGIMPVHLHPFTHRRDELIENGVDEDLADRTIAEAELLFLSQFQSRAGNLLGNDWGDFLSGIEDSDEPDSDLEDGTELTDVGQPSSDSGNQVQITVGYWGNVARAQAKEETSLYEDEAKKQSKKADNEDVDQKSKRLKDEFKALKRALSELSRQSAQDKAKYEKELLVLRREHRELADLRELVFNQENVDDTAPEPIKDDIAFPYETKLRTVVFGGHESFLKQIRPRFSNVRFVDAEQYAFSTDIVRNADIVWIQNNRISHSQYYRIINTARQYGIQVRYFPYASADKCALLMVNEDGRL